VESGKKSHKEKKHPYLPENFIPLEEHNCLNLIENETELYPGIANKNI